MSTGSSTESYPTFAHIGLRENPGKNLNQDSNSEYNFAVGGFISYHRFNIKEEITWTKFYCTEIVRGYGRYPDKPNPITVRQQLFLRRRRQCSCCR
ncbi:hypothetical protein ANN_02218 [Periplaneta americana]|uniref:Uncharacterized protein n=1 Tax=Periplaneta americana TaxID=6978 RepID=A0ABQ8TWS5_PERAM|nr:hypothetical protein ANN_02218 [Periplaneta americana]